MSFRRFIYLMNKMPDTEELLFFDTFAHGTIEVLNDLHTSLIFSIISNFLNFGFFP